MCGISGFIDHSLRGLSESKYRLNCMLNRIFHRGPDEMGLFITGDCCIGSVRLSIIDTKFGQQPLCTPEGRYWIAYNGEVYNHDILREELEEKGHVFKTKCDTEVVVHMFAEYKEKCLQYLNGQFAFSIWDTELKRLFIARDRVGIRPLYYTLQGGKFVFGSEIKAILEYPNIKKEINKESLKEIFTFWSALAPNTFFKDIYELPSGHFAYLKNGNLDVERYWDYSFSIDKQITIEDAKEQFTYLFKDSLNLRMKADVPVAAYLSGGLDSTSTTAFIKNQFPNELNTFSIGFEEREFDETVYQREVAEYLNTNHHSITFRNEDVVGYLEKTLWHTEIPILRTSPLPMFKLSELVKNNDIKVVITGEGADEVLGGYNIFKEAIIREFWAKYPKSKIRPLLLKKLYPYLTQFQNGKSVNYLKLFFGYQLSNTNSPVYSHLLRWNNSSKILNHLSEEYKLNLQNYDPVLNYVDQYKNKLNGYTLLNKAQFIETNIFMSGYLLSSQGDRVGMGNSVEVRYPFLDHRILEFCATLPDTFKLKGLNEKYLLKSVVKDHIPNSVLKRPKQAYRAPIQQALLNDKSGFVNDVLQKSKLKDSGIFDCGSVETLINRMKSGRIISEMDNMALMAVLSTQIIEDKFIKNNSVMHIRHEGVVRN